MGLFYNAPEHTRGYCVEQHARTKPESIISSSTLISACHQRWSQHINKLIQSCRHYRTKQVDLGYSKVTQSHTGGVSKVLNVFVKGGSALFRQAVFRQALFRQALFRQAVFQYGTIPPTRLFNYQFLILVYKQMFTITSYALLPIC